MKKLSFLVVLMLLSLMVSCQKEEINENTESDQESVDFDKSNSEKVQWDKFPEQLKNAIPIKNDVEDVTKAYSYSAGPYGGNGGGYFNVNPPANTKIYAIAIRSGSLIDKIVIYYISPAGLIYVGASRGGNGGGYHIQFFSSDEYITKISGRSGSLLDRLTIKTNKKSFSYGGNGGQYFNVPIPPNGFQVLGFFGRSGSLVDQIGFHIHTL